MTPRTQLGFLWAVCGLLALAAAGSAAAFFAWPLETCGPADAEVPAEDAPGRPAAGRPALSSYSVMWERDLQRPLFDPAPVVATPSPPPKPPLKLVGTVIEPRLSYALLKDKAGQTKMVGAGQSHEGLEVIEVTADAARVRFAGTEHVLKVEKEGQTP